MRAIKLLDTVSEAFVSSIILNNEVDMLNKRDFTRYIKNNEVFMDDVLSAIADTIGASYEQQYEVIYTFIKNKPNIKRKEVKPIIEDLLSGYTAYNVVNHFAFQIITLCADLGLLDNNEMNLIVSGRNGMYPLFTQNGDGHSRNKTILSNENFEASIETIRLWINAQWQAGYKANTFLIPRAKSSNTIALYLPHIKNCRYLEVNDFFNGFFNGILNPDEIIKHIAMNSKVYAKLRDMIEQQLFRVIDPTQTIQDAVRKLDRLANSVGLTDKKQGFAAKSR